MRATMGAMRRGLLLLLLGLSRLPALESATALGEADAPVFDEDVPFTAKVTVRNPNDFAVHVERLDASCTCTHLAMATKFLLPKAAATLTAEVSNANRSGYQDMGVSVFFTDPDCELVPVALRWHVRPLVTVDALPPGWDPQAGRPEDRAWQDVYRFTAQARPDELRRLRKRVLIRATPELAPADGFKILGLDYTGTTWAFATEDLGGGTWLIRARARDEDAVAPDGTTDEKVLVRTNHPRKATIPLEFAVLINRDLGRLDIPAP